MDKVLDGDTGVLAAVAASLRDEYDKTEEDAKWKDSPFDWIRHLPPSQKGKIGVQLISGWCATHGLNVNRSDSSGSDKVLEGFKIEFKFSLLWASNIYKFQQIRKQDYVYLVCLGISPFDAHCWIIQKELALLYATPQHTGHTGQETFWITIDPNDPPDWLENHGGKLSEAYKIFKSW